MKSKVIVLDLIDATRRLVLVSSITELIHKYVIYMCDILMVWRLFRCLYIITTQDFILQSRF